MKNFEISLVKMGMTVDEKFGNTLEIDDLSYVWTKEKKFSGFDKVIKYLNRYYSKIPVGDSLDKIDPYTRRYYIDTACYLYDDAKDLSSDDVGMAYFYIRQFKYEDNDPKYGDKLFFYDGSWETYN